MASGTDHSEDDGSSLLCDETEELLTQLCSLQPELKKCGEQLLEEYKKLPEDLPHLNEYLKTLIMVLKTKDSGSWRNVWGLLSRGKPSVKVLTVVSSETFGADEQILQKMKDKVNLIPADPADCDLVLIFCVVNSRVGSDVEAVMLRIPEAAREKPVALVLMFHTRKENHQTEETQWSSRYENVKFQTEVLFHRSRNGLLKCDRNNQAIQKLVDQLQAVKSMVSSWFSSPERSPPQLRSDVSGLVSSGKPSVKVHVIVSSETFGADEQILQKLKDKVNLIPADPADCDLVLIFCVVVSRVGSDVEAVMLMIPEAAREKPVALVLMFHTRKENHQTQWSSRYENVKFQTEVLFHRSRHGLLKCDRNNQAIQKLVDLVYRAKTE